MVGLYRGNGCHGDEYVGICCGSFFERNLVISQIVANLPAKRDKYFPILPFTKGLVAIF